LAYAGVILGRGTAYMIGVLMIAALLAVEHALVRPSDLSKLNKAFFDVNGYVSVAFLVFVGIDHLVH
jgi:4-hydroxybenzoate polyprenyltransferase